MDKNAARERILAMPVLAPLGPALREKIADVFLTMGAPERIPANTTLFTRGDASDGRGIVLLDGEVSVLKEGNPEVVALAPDLLGEMAQLNPTKQRTATVNAATDLVVMRFKWPTFTKAAQQKLSDEDIEAFTAALQEYAWQHFTE